MVTSISPKLQNSPRLFSSISFQYVVYMRNYSDHEKINLEMLKNVHIFSAPDNEKVSFGVLSVCIYVRMCTSLVPE